MGDAGLGFPVPAQIVGDAHRAGGITRHRVDATVCGAGSGGHDRRGLGCQPIEPFAGGDRLSGLLVVAETAPVAVVVEFLVGNRPLDDQHERFEFTPVGLAEPLEEVVGATFGPALEVDERPVHRDLRQTRQRPPECDLLDGGLHRGGERDGVTVAAEAGVDPQHVYQRVLGRQRLWCRHAEPPSGVPVHSCTVGVDRRPTCTALLLLGTRQQRIVNGGPAYGRE